MNGPILSSDRNEIQLVSVHGKKAWHIMEQSTPRTVSSPPSLALTLQWAPQSVLSVSLVCLHPHPPERYSCGPHHRSGKQSVQLETDSRRYCEAQALTLQPLLGRTLVNVSPRTALKTTFYMWVWACVSWQSSGCQGTTVECQFSHSTFMWVLGIKQFLKWWH